MYILHIVCLVYSITDVVDIPDKLAVPKVFRKVEPGLTHIGYSR